jgi:hypothetical protein
MATLPTWMRRALFATGIMNTGAALGFLPGARFARVAAGLPEDAPSVYLLTIAMFVGLFGVGYLWTAVSGRAERLFITIAAIGKLTFVTLVTTMWATGTLSARAPVAGSPDLVFALLFFAWLIGDRQA